MRGFVKAKRPGYGIERLKLAGAGAAFVWKKTGEMKFLSGQTAGGQGGGEGTRPGYTFHAMTCLEHRAHNAFAGIADTRRAGITNQRNRFALSESIK